MARKHHSFSWMEHQHCGIVLSECYLKLCEFERTLYETYSPSTETSLLKADAPADRALQAATRARQDLEELIKAMQELIASDFPQAGSLEKALPYRTENRLLPKASSQPPMKKRGGGSHTDS